MTVCEHVRGTHPSASPFFRLLATGYYDGPTDGFVECNVCRQAYAFHMLDWDDEQDVRIFGLAPVRESFESIWREILELPPSEEPITLVSPLVGQASLNIERLESQPIQYVVGVENLLRDIVAGEPVEQGEVGKRDWFAWLGM